MSIINQTLRDLDARQPVEPVVVDIAPSPRPAKMNVRKALLKRVVIVVLGGALLVGSPAAWLTFRPTALPAARAPVSVAPSSSLPNPPAPVEQAVPEAAEPALALADPTAESVAISVTTPAEGRLAASAETVPSADAGLQLDASGATPRVPSLRLDTQVITPVEPRGAAISKEPRKLIPEEEAEDRYRRALLLVNKGRETQARPLLDDALRLAPGHVAARQVLATLFDEAGMTRDAERVLRQGRTVSPDTTWFTLSLARLLVARGELDEAAALLRSDLEGRSVTADYHAAYGAILSRLKRPAEAGRQYEHALATQPHQGNWWMGLALALAEQGRRAEARAAYERALAAGNLGERLEAFVRAKLSE